MASTNFISYEQAAQVASATATRINSIVTISQNAYSTAITSRDSAAEYAKSAEQSALEAKQAKVDAVSAQGSATQSASNANSSAQSAYNSSSTAANYATQAQSAYTDADKAKSSAQTAASSASQAQSLAEGARDSANSYANTANEAMTACDQYKNSAESSALSASTSALSASTSANNASQYETNAKSAAQAAETAKTQAESIINTAILKTAMLESIENYSSNDTVPTSKAVTDALAKLSAVALYEVISDFPDTSSAKTNVIYLKPKDETQTNNAYDEYLYNSNTKTFEKIGDTEIDLSGYMLKTDVVELTSGQLANILSIINNTTTTV